MLSRLLRGPCQPCGSAGGDAAAQEDAAAAGPGFPRRHQPSLRPAGRWGDVGVTNTCRGRPGGGGGRTAGADAGAGRRSGGGRGSPAGQRWGCRDILMPPVLSMRWAPPRVVKREVVCESDCAANRRRCREELLLRKQTGRRMKTRQKATIRSTHGSAGSSMMSPLAPRLPHRHPHHHRLRLSSSSPHPHLQHLWHCSSWCRERRCLGSYPCRCRWHRRRRCCPCRRQSGSGTSAWRSRRRKWPLYCGVRNDPCIDQHPQMLLRISADS